MCLRVLRVHVFAVLGELLQRCVAAPEIASHSAEPYFDQVTAEDTLLTQYLKVHCVDGLCVFQSAKLLEMASLTRATPVQLLQHAQRRLFCFFLTSMSWPEQYGVHGPQADEEQQASRNEVRFAQVLAKPLSLFRILGLATFTPTKTRKAIMNGTSSSRLWNKLVIVFNTHIAIINTYCLVRTPFVGGDLHTFFVLCVAWTGYAYVALLLLLVLRQTKDFVQVLNRLLDLEEKLRSQLGCLSLLGRQPTVIYLTFGIMFNCVTLVGLLVSSISRLQLRILTLKSVMMVFVTNFRVPILAGRTSSEKGSPDSAMKIMLGSRLRVYHKVGFSVSDKNLGLVSHQPCWKAQISPASSSVPIPDHQTRIV
jgi:hypothetical protein